MARSAFDFAQAVPSNVEGRGTRPTLEPRFLLFLFIR
jgi:hypothetical protein